MKHIINYLGSVCLFYCCGICVYFAIKTISIPRNPACLILILIASIALSCAIYTLVNSIIEQITDVKNK